MAVSATAAPDRGLGILDVTPARVRPRVTAIGDPAIGEPHVGEQARVQLAQIQRSRILAAMFDAACERGAANVSVADVVERSGVSRRTFYELFEDREACFLAAFEQALALAAERVLPAFAQPAFAQRSRTAKGTGWRERIRGAVIALLGFLDEEPLAGRLLVVESLSGGPRTLARRTRVLAQLASAVDAGRSESATAAALPPLTAEGLVGGALAVIHARIARAESAPLLELANQLTSMIVLPYLGQAAARRELERPVQPRALDTRGATRAAAAHCIADPFKDAGMRLTYRTVRVLLAVAELGEQGAGPSNRTVGARAGISDQGQTSKLLARLRRIGLIANSGLAPGQGAPNAWTLTDSGRELTDRIRANASAGEHTNFH
jgi:AcrR family transcriptional regulator